MEAQTLISLGATAACGALAPNAVCVLTAEVTGTPANVTWILNPADGGGLIAGPDNAPVNGITTKRYTAPGTIAARTVVTVTARTGNGLTDSVQIILTPATIGVT